MPSYALNTSRELCHEEPERAQAEHFLASSSGRALIQHESSGPDAGLLRPGIYRVEITHPSESIDAKFNSQTTLGHTVTRGPQINDIVFEVQYQVLIYAGGTPARLT